MFGVTVLKIFGRVGRQTYFFLEKIIILCILPFKMHMIIFFPENLKINLDRAGLSETQICFFLFGLIVKSMDFPPICRDNP